MEALVARKPILGPSVLESTVPLHSVVGNTVLLLVDWDKFSLSERVSYHFDLLEALGVVSDDRSEAILMLKATSSDEEAKDGVKLHPFCGVSALLECVPKDFRLRSEQKRKLKHEIRHFNAQAARVRRRGKKLCHRPIHLPLKINSTSNVMFAYETTRIAFCLDASPTLTSTFGFTGNSKGKSVCCPVDNLIAMARTFFKALAEPVHSPTFDSTRPIWKPELSVTVLAVFPRARSGPLMKLLVRDYRVRDVAGAEVLVEKMSEWLYGDVESEIATRLAHPTDNMSILTSYEAGIMPMYSSSLRDLLDAGDAALATLSSAARPLIVLATDCRCVSCDAVVDILADVERVDVPVIVLDLSSPESHSISPSSRANRTENDLFQDLSYDNGPRFPLHLSDDSDSLHAICKATGGCFFDSQLLSEAAETVAGHVKTESILLLDHFFSYKRHAIHPNAVQWYCLFSMSPLSPLLHSHLGKLPPPEYIRRAGRLEAPTKDRGDRKQALLGSVIRSFDRPGPGARDHLTLDVRRDPSESALASTQVRRVQVRTTFATYIVNPIRIKNLVLMRIKEGYRAKLYGSNTADPDKVSIQLSLPLDLGNHIHYELSFKSTSDLNHLVGFARVKIELSGEEKFVQLVKNEYLSHGQRPLPVTLAQQVSVRLCEVLRWIRTEDMLQSHLSPLIWSDQLANGDTPFVKRLDSLSHRQRRRHFRFDEFDVVVKSDLYFVQEEPDFLIDFREVLDGEQELKDTLTKWSSRPVRDSRLFVRQTDSPFVSYSLVELTRCPRASKVFTVSIQSFAETDPTERLALVDSLKQQIAALRAVEVLPKQMGAFLVGMRARDMDSPVHPWERLLEGQHSHASWDLVQDPELFPLLLRRRTAIDKFLPMEVTESRAVLAKLITDAGSGEDDAGPGDLVQYGLRRLKNKVVVDLHMESAGGLFFPHRTLESDDTHFQRLLSTLKKRDQECGKALRCRTNLLKTLDGAKEPEAVASCVRRLLAYATRSTMKLRFFHLGSGLANAVLRSLTDDTLLSGTLGARVAKIPFATGPGADGMEGDWYVVDFDKHTMSIVRLSTLERVDVSQEDGRGLAYRELVFSTISISDLYSVRDDVADDESEDNKSEYLCVGEFSDRVAAAHARNYSSAAYLALRSEVSPSQFHRDDLVSILEPLEFVETADVWVAGDGSHSKLFHIIQTLLQPIAEDSILLYYNGRELARDVGEGKIFQFLEDDDRSSGSISIASSQLEKSSDVNDDDRSSPSTSNGTIPENNSIRSDPDLSIPACSGVTAPMFVQLHLAGNPVTIHDLSRIDKSSKLTVHLSVFRRNRNVDSPSLPASHSRAAGEIEALLASFTAEQTLERLRHRSVFPGEEDLSLAKSCLKKALDAVIWTVDVFFYAAKVDVMVPASDPAGCNSEIATGFKLLFERLRKNETLSLVTYLDGFVAETTAYWCFVTFRRARGVITIEVHHPDGPNKASGILTLVHEEISRCCHWVNQLLLVQRLHQSRIASSLLIAPEDEDNNIDEDGGSNPFSPGLFTCPVVFRTSFECGSNPTQVARSLEASVLHMFAILNRTDVFVYKDESGSIFYMKLVPGCVDSIELVVSGITEPTQSITQQLTALLRKRLLLLAKDVLASKLTSQFQWKAVDVSFVKSFEESWSSLEENYVAAGPRVQIYKLPEIATDPGLLLLYFRQNLCGSTFFHDLNASDSNEDRVHESNRYRLSFYFNNTPMKQTLSTLTSKGSHYANLIGSGIAIIEVDVLDSVGSSVVDLLTVGEAAPVELTKPLSRSSLAFVNATGIGSRTQSSQLYLSVAVSDTCLKRDELHDWILLCLNQSALDFAVERHLERTQRTGATGGMDLPFPSEWPPGAFVDDVAPGLTTLYSFLNIGAALPNPSVLKVDVSGIIRSSSVSEVVTGFLEILQRTIVDQQARRGAVHDDLIAFRFSRHEKARLVEFKLDRARNPKLVLCERSSDTRIVDTPVDCPEYVVFFATPEYKDSVTQTISPSKLYEEVALEEGSDGKDYLRQARNQFPRIFRRAFSFILSVKRNRRLLLAYNWSPHLFKVAASNLRDKNHSYLVSAEVGMASMQQRSLRLLSPTATKSAPPRGLQSSQHLRNDSRGAVRTGLNIPQQVNEEEEAQLEHIQTGRRAVRPASIRRPKLIGKSVEGAAMQAMAASRARASSNMFKTTSNTSTTGNRKISDPTLRQPLGKPGGPKKLDTGDGILSNLSHDRDARKAVGEYYASTSPSKTNLKSDLTLHQHAFGALTSTLWPIYNRDISQPTTGFFLSKLLIVQDSVVELPSMPNRLLGSFIVTFGESLCYWSPGLRFYPFAGDAIFLCGEIRGLKHFQMLILAHLSGKLLRLKTWAIAFPRKAESSAISLRRSQSRSERVCTGIDSLAADVREALPLERMLFDHLASLVERSVKSFDDCTFVPRILRETLAEWPIERQVMCLRPEYKIYTTLVVLRSYEDPLIDKFEGASLFYWLSLNADKKNIVVCSDSVLAFKREIVVRGTYSLCLLSTMDTGRSTLQMTLVCRCHGRDINEFIFPQGSLVAVSIMDYVAFEGAGLVYEELKTAATHLHLQRLWEKVSKYQPDGELQLVPTQLELLDLGILFGCPNIEESVRWGPCFSSIGQVQNPEPNQGWGNKRGRVVSGVI